MQLALLPEPSVKVYVTAVVPTGKKVPGAWVLDEAGVAPELSVAVGSVHVTVVPVTPLLTVVETSLMHETVGGMVSTIKEKRIHFVYCKMEIFMLHLFSRFSRSNLAARK